MNIIQREILSRNQNNSFLHFALESSMTSTNVRTQMEEYLLDENNIRPNVTFVMMGNDDIVLGISLDSFRHNLEVILARYV